MNEYYAKDISKKRRIVNKMKGNAGIPLSPPPYGYIKTRTIPVWVVDPVAADVVRRIYRMALEGYGLAETAAALGADGIVNPTYYWRSKGTSRGGSKSTLEPTKWGHTTIKKILTTQEYCGDVINFKSYSKSYKMKRRIETRRKTGRSSSMFTRLLLIGPLGKGTGAEGRNPAQAPHRHPRAKRLSGVMKCPECGGNLNFHFNQNNHDIKFSVAKTIIRGCVNARPPTIFGWTSWSRSFSTRCIGWPVSPTSTKTTLSKRWWAARQR